MDNRRPAVLARALAHAADFRRGGMLDLARVQLAHARWLRTTGRA